MSLGNTSNTRVTPADPGPWLDGDDTERAQVRVVSSRVGVGFLVLGALGFVPGITAHYGSLGFAGQGSQAMLLGLFQVSILLNVVHLLFGVAGIMGVRTAVASRNFLLTGGIVLGLIWLYGLLIDRAGSSNVLSVNTADNWLHLLLALGMVGLAVWLGRRRTTAATA